MDERDLTHLRRCVELAREALDAGDEPFGSVLVDAYDVVCAEDRNRTAAGDQTRHPEFALARWAATYLSPEERAGATVYTSGEHCAMCSAAHAWVGLARIVYVASTEQLVAWRREFGLTGPSPVNPLPVNAVAPASSSRDPHPSSRTRSASCTAGTPRRPLRARSRRSAVRRGRRRRPRARRRRSAPATGRRPRTDRRMVIVVSETSAVESRGVDEPRVVAADPDEVLVDRQGLGAERQELGRGLRERRPDRVVAARLVELGAGERLLVAGVDRRDARRPP